MDSDGKMKALEERQDGAQKVANDAGKQLTTDINDTVARLRKARLITAW